MTIADFLRLDHEGHLGHSEAELRLHADPDSNKTVSERKAYFFGIMTVFPLMLLSHYYEWLTQKSVQPYMDTFVPAMEEQLQPITKALLDELYQHSEDQACFAASISSYLASVPFVILRAFGQYALTEEQCAHIPSFVNQELSSTLPALITRLSSEGKAGEARTALVVYLGGDYPFELLGRFHNAVVEGNEG